MNKELWEKAVAFHGHACPGLALGVRLCEFVQQELGVGVSPDEELVCIAETDSCPVDAVQAILGCTRGTFSAVGRARPPITSMTAAPGLAFELSPGETRRSCPGRSAGVKFWSPP